MVELAGPEYGSETFFTGPRAPGCPWVRIFQTAGAANGELKFRCPAGADVGGVVIHGEAVAGKAELDVHEPDEGVEVEDIEHLVAGPFRWIRIPDGVLALFDDIRIPGEIGHAAQHGFDHVADHRDDLLRVERLLRLVVEDESHVRPDNVLHELGHVVVVRLADLVHRGHDHVDLLGEIVGIAPGWFVAKYELVADQRIAGVARRGGSPEQASSLVSCGAKRLRRVDSEGGVWEVCSPPGSG